jgi:hypothetical protein
LALLLHRPPSPPAPLNVAVAAPAPAGDIETTAAAQAAVRTTSREDDERGGRRRWRRDERVMLWLLQNVRGEMRGGAALLAIVYKLLRLQWNGNKDAKYQVFAGLIRLSPVNSFGVDGT